MDDLIRLNMRIGEMEQQGGDAAAFFTEHLSDDLVFRRASGHPEAENKSLLAKVPSEARECLQLIVQAFDEGKMRIPDDRIIAKQNAAKSIDTASVVEGGKHPCLNKRG